MTTLLILLNDAATRVCVAQDAAVLRNSPPAVPLPELQALLTAPAFLRSFFRALALNHRKAATEGGGSGGGEQWSLGVQEVLADSIREGKTVFPSTRLGLMSVRGSVKILLLLPLLLLDPTATAIRMLKRTAAIPCLTRFDRFTFGLHMCNHVYINVHSASTTTLKHDSGTFWVRNARLVEELVRTVGPTVLLLPLMTAVHAVLADGTVAHEDKRMYQCAAAEVVAGCIRGFTRGTTSAAGDTPGDALTEQLWEHIMPLLELQLADTSLDSSVDWCDAVRLCYDTSTAADSAAAAATAALLEPLTLLLCSNVQAVLSSTAARDDFAEQTLWLRLLQ
eukprot:7100-Heterococcus_DN1.PRE.1